MGSTPTIFWHWSGPATGGALRTQWLRCSTTKPSATTQHATAGQRWQSGRQKRWQWFVGSPSTSPSTRELLSCSRLFPQPGPQIAGSDTTRPAPNSEADVSSHPRMPGCSRTQRWRRQSRPSSTLGSPSCTLPRPIPSAAMLPTRRAQSLPGRCPVSQSQLKNSRRSTRSSPTRGLSSQPILLKAAPPISLQGQQDHVPGGPQASREGSETNRKGTTRPPPPQRGSNPPAKKPSPNGR